MMCFSYPCKVLTEMTCICFDTNVSRKTPTWCSPSTSTDWNNMQILVNIIMITVFSLLYVACVAGVYLYAAQLAARLRNTKYSWLAFCVYILAIPAMVIAPISCVIGIAVWCITVFLGFAGYSLYYAFGAATEILRERSSA